jgi:hypothetical protein
VGVRQDQGGPEDHTETAEAATEDEPGGQRVGHVLGGAGLFLLGFAQIFEMSALLFVGATSMAASAATVWQQKHQSGGVPGPAVARPNSAKPRGNAVPGGRRAKPGTAVPNCTRTGQPIDQCSCSARHVASQAGVQRYKQAKRVGDPIGGKAPVHQACGPSRRSRGCRPPTTPNRSRWASRCGASCDPNTKGPPTPAFLPRQGTWMVWMGSRSESTTGGTASRSSTATSDAFCPVGAVTPKVCEPALAAVW